jgi:hypothetical protein
VSLVDLEKLISFPALRDRGVTAHVVLRDIAAGRLRALRLGGRYYFRPEDVEAWEHGAEVRAVACAEARAPKRTTATSSAAVRATGDR